MPRSTHTGPPHVRNLADLAKRKDIAVVAKRDRTIGDVAFDEFVVEPTALIVRGTLLERCRNSTGQVVAAASVEWPEMPIGWTALQSRRGDDHLGLGEEDDDESIGHALFDRTFAVDTDDPGSFSATFRPTLLEWIVDFEVEHGPLTIIFDGTIDADRRRGPTVAAIYVARDVANDDEFVATSRLAATLADQLSATVER